MPQIGDLFAKLAQGQQLTSGEIEQLRLGMNQQQQMASTVAGLVNVDGSLDLSFLPIRILYNKRLVVATSSIDINIPSDINNLIFFGAARTDEADWWDHIDFNFNDDAGANYEYQELDRTATTTGGGSSRAHSVLPVSGAPGASADANFTGPWFTVIPNIGSALFKGSLSICGGRYTETANVVAIVASWWENTSRVKKITLTPGEGTNFVVGSSFSVLGIV